MQSELHRRSHVPPRYRKTLVARSHGLWPPGFGQGLRQEVEIPQFPMILNNVVHDEEGLRKVYVDDKEAAEQRHNVSV